MALVSTLAGRGFRTLSSVSVFLVGACPACLGDLLVGTALPELSLVLRLLRGLAGLVPGTCARLHEEWLPLRRARPAVFVRA